MNNRWAFYLLLGLASGSWADAAPPQKLHPPYFLRAQDIIPGRDLACPDLPIQGADGKSRDMANNINPPDTGVMDQFSGLSLFEDLQKTKASETVYKKFYWHNNDGLDYCHFKDVEGNHWYGWAGRDGNFNWILWRGKRYWWRDPFAGHWLYYYQGSWWRSDAQAKNSIQACLDGEYYACDALGNILGDMGQDGSGSIVSAPGRYQGDSHRGHGGHGGHGGHEGHGGTSGQGQPSAGSPQGGSPSSAPQGTAPGSAPGN